MVLEILGPEFEKRGLRTLQLGAKDEQPLPRCERLMGRTTLRQAAYVVKHSSLHLCVDTFTGHLAGFYGVPCVVLVSNNYARNVVPYFADKGKLSVFEPDRSKILPSFSYEDPDRQVDTFRAEDIAAEALRLLDGGKPDWPYRSRWFGGLSQQKILEMAPCAPVDAAAMGAQNIVVRMDYVHNEEVLWRQCQICPVTLVALRPIGRRVLDACASRIDRAFVLVDDGYDVGFLRDLRDSGIKFAMFTNGDEAWLRDKKLDLLDFGVCHVKGVATHASVDEIKDAPADRLVFRSNKFVVGGAKIYPSKWHWLAGESIPSLECPFLPVPDHPDFWRDLDHVEIFERKL